MINTHNYKYIEYHFSFQFQKGFFSRQETDDPQRRNGLTDDGGAQHLGRQEAQHGVHIVVAGLVTTQQAAASVGTVDPSRLTRSQIEDIKKRAERGEKITF